MKKHYKSIFLSDCHLGSSSCKAEYLLNLLNSYTFDNLFLVGDIIDGWRLKASFYWPQEHSNVLNKILELAKNGTKIFYIVGNHDEFLKKYFKKTKIISAGNICVALSLQHTAADGKKWLIIHGDDFDSIIRSQKWLAFLGDNIYDFLLWINRYIHEVQRALHRPYWSLSAYLKQKTKKAVAFISKFEDAVAWECHKLKLDGVICGHIHHAEIRKMNGIIYMNCGDFVESCSFLAEETDGSVVLMHWGDGRNPQEIKRLKAGNKGIIYENPNSN